ncbi:MAG: DUF1549 domain-containing protein [Planctomycetales bacterium]|nr:DUF1549 domain-containing protein [Planctomycetales bacterium]
MTRRMLAVVWISLLSFGWIGVERIVAQSTSDDFPGLGPAGPLTGIAFEQSGVESLQGPNARLQLVVTGNYASGQLHDLTKQVSFQTTPNGIVQIDDNGFVSPVANGEVVITAREASGKTATTKLLVEQLDRPQPINFANEIVPIFTKLGCNTGGCHGKSDGQNGFKLSLLGFYPNEDYEYLVKENRGRRVFPAAPEYSLLLLKPANQLPHGGGHRLDPDSYEWRLITRWIEQGMPYGSEDDPVVERIEVFPKARSLNREEEQQLSVVAHYSDGSRRDVTQLATYESNDPRMADSTRRGRVTVYDLPGDVAMMVRFQGHVTVFRASIPQGLPVDSLPPTRTLVDQHVFQKLKSLGIPPSPLCDDSTFIRRVTVDIAGRLPTAEEARAFVENKDPNKRDKLIDLLLDSPNYGDYFANKWASVLRNKRRQDVDREYTFRFHSWIRQAMQSNMPYDQFVRSVLAASGEVESYPPVAWYKEVSTSTQQMEDTAQLFLGQRIQCAHCHHHPFERWSQDDYFSFEAFFSQVGRKPGRDGMRDSRVYHKVGAATSENPRSGEKLVPRGLGGEPLEIQPYEDPRHRLVDWMTEPNNPFFAKALVNRYWKHFFGRGIVDPEDDMRITNPPSNPELLDGLAKSFVDSKYDLKGLIRTICRSSVYQLSSEPTDYNRDDRLNFSSFYPRRLNAEPLYDAVNQVAGTYVNFNGMPRGTRAIQLPDNGFNDYFLTVFGKPEAESACECERSSEANLAQSLHLLNSTDIQGKLASGEGRAAVLARDAERTDAQKVEELYYWAYARPPRASELEVVLPYIEKKSNKQQAYEDLMWAMFNTKEFLFNR